MSNDYKYEAINDMASPEMANLGRGRHPYPSAMDRDVTAGQNYANQAQAYASQLKVGAMGGLVNKPIDRGLRQEAMEILGLIHGLESGISELRTQLFGSFPEAGECSKADRDPSLSETLVQARVALGRLLETVSLLRSKSE